MYHSDDRLTECDFAEGRHFFWRKTWAAAADKPEVAMARGYESFITHDYREALLRFSEAGAADGSAEPALLWAARARLALGDAAAARVLVDEVLERRPGWPPAVLESIRLLDARHDRPRILERIAELRGRHPTKDTLIEVFQHLVRLNEPALVRSVVEDICAVAGDEPRVNALRAYAAHKAGPGRGGGGRMAPGVGDAGGGLRRGGCDGRTAPRTR
jgi:hypothetical protein